MKRKSAKRKATMFLMTEHTCVNFSKLKNVQGQKTSMMRSVMAINWRKNGTKL